MGVEERDPNEEIIKIQNSCIETMKNILEIQREEKSVLYEIIKNKDNNGKDVAKSITKYFFIFLAGILITLFICSYCFPSQNVNINDNKNHTIEERE